MSYTLRFSKSALEDIESHKKSGDKGAVKKLEKLLNELKDHPTTGSGQPEQLKHNLAGLYSRRINKKHRVVYAVHEEQMVVDILSAWAHYREK